MSNTGYCTLEDLRRALRSASLPGDIGQDNQIGVDKIAAQTEELEKRLKRHWYAPSDANILDEASAVDIPKSPNTRDDEHDIPRHGAQVHGASERRHHRRRKNSDVLLESTSRYDAYRRDDRRIKQTIRIATGTSRALEPPIDETVPAYTRIRLDRKDADAINALNVIGEDGSYTDWVASNNYDGGAGLTNRGKDYWARTNNNGVSELYLDVHALDDDIASLSNAVYIDWDYGHEGIPQAIRSAVALRAAAELVDEPAFSIPDNAQVRGVDSLASEMNDRAEELLSEYE